MTGDAVAAAADGELQPALACERNHARDVCCVLSPDDECWAAVEPAVEDGARLVVAVVVGAYDPARTSDENSRMVVSSRRLAWCIPRSSCRLSVMI